MDPSQVRPEGVDVTETTAPQASETDDLDKVPDLPVVESAPLDSPEPPTDEETKELVEQHNAFYRNYPTRYHRGQLVFDPRIMAWTQSLNVAIIFANLNMKNMEKEGRAWREMGKIAKLVESGTVAGELMRREIEGVLYERNRIRMGEYLPCHVCGELCPGDTSFERITRAYNIGAVEVRETRRVHTTCFNSLKIPYVETTQIVDRDGQTIIGPDGSPLAARGNLTTD
jgi:RNA polymerase-binding transcription factor DksA